MQGATGRNKRLLGLLLTALSLVVVSFGAIAGGGGLHGSVGWDEESPDFSEEDTIKGGGPLSVSDGWEPSLTFLAFTTGGGLHYPPETVQLGKDENEKYVVWGGIIICSEGPYDVIALMDIANGTNSESICSSEEQGQAKGTKITPKGTIKITEVTGETGGVKLKGTIKMDQGYTFTGDVLILVYTEKGGFYKMAFSTPAENGNFPAKDGTYVTVTGIPAGSYQVRAFVNTNHIPINSDKTPATVK